MPPDVAAMLPLGSAFIAALLCIDQRMAEEVRAGKCQVCGGPLHSNPYHRKPRGVPPEWVRYFGFRLSLTCASCNKRHTPPSVRFLERRLYVAFVVVLTSAVNTGLTDFRIKKLTEWFNVPRQTLERWCTWWREIFAKSTFFKVERGRFRALPALEDAALPASLLARFEGDDLWSRLCHCLEFLSPLSKGRGTAGRSFAFVV
jgi:hypothetical protein